MADPRQTSWPSRRSSLALSVFVCLGALALEGEARAQACPTSGQDVTISSPCTFNAGTYTFTGTLTIAATVTAASNVGSAPVSLVSDHIDITATGSVVADGRGFAGGAGPSSSTGGAVGGGHGGVGGGGTLVHGDITAPTTLGSGGGGASGAAGGGAIKLQAAGTLTVNGTLSANGASFVSTVAGGAGGSIWLVAQTLAGGGLVRVNGGQGWNTYGGGGGGRIAVDVQVDGSTLFSGTRLQAYGNHGSAGAIYGPAGAGTIWTRVAPQVHGTLRVDNNAVVGAATPTRGSMTLDALELRNQGLLRVDSPHVLTMASTGQVTGAGTGRLTINSGATFVAPSATMTLSGFATTLSGTWQTTTSLTVLSGSFVHAGTFSPALQQLTVGNAATFTRSGLSTLELDTLLVQSGGTLNHSGNTNAESHKLNVVANTITVDAGGTVSADGRGFTGGNGPSSSTSGSVAGGHGGVGGNNSLAHGSITAPTSFGSGGGGASGLAGGGAIKLEASGTLTVNGTITANGLSFSGTDAGGAGGSIWLVAQTLAGGGLVRVNGGQGWNTYGGGGGGRIAVDVQVDGSTLLSGTRLQAYGNHGSAGAIYGPAGAGTIWTRVAPQVHGTLRVDNNAVVGGATPTRGSMTLDVLEVRNQGFLRVDSPHVLTMVSTGQVTGAGTGRLTINSGATFVAPSATKTLSGFATTLSGTWQTTTSLTVLSGSFVHAGTFSPALQQLTVGNAATFTRSGLSTLELDTLLVQSGGTLNHSGNTNAESHKLNVVANTITIDAGGTVSADGRGFTGGNGPSSSTSGSVAGGHGGVGGNNSLAHGSVTAPTSFGSGGGGASGLAGGGAIKLEASGTLTVNGTITANGLSFSGTDAGGAGGSIWLVAQTLAGGGLVRVNGGQGWNTYGGGGGGRIAVDVQVDGSTLLSGTRLQAYGNHGSAGAIYGPAGAGTIWTRVAPQVHGTLRVDNNAVVGGATPTRGSMTLDVLEVRNQGFLRVDSPHVLTMVSTGQVTGAGTGRLTINSGATFVAPSATTTLSGFATTLSGTWQTTTSLTVLSGSFVHAGTFSPALQQLTVGNAATFTRSGLSSLELDTLLVQSGGTLNHSGNANVESHKLNVVANTITIDAGGTVSADGRGFTGGNGPSSSTSGSVAGGHGGVGGNNSLEHGSVTAPTSFGSGGGGTSGLPGGGAIKLEATGTLTVNGTITANGSSFSGTDAGGAGGSIWLVAQTLAGGGLVRVNGGQGWNNYGGGGGGRIAIDAQVDSSTLLSGTRLQAYGNHASGGPTLAPGGAGTIWTRVAPQTHGALRIDNNNVLAARTPTLGSATFDALQVRNGAFFRVESGHTLSTGPVSGSSSGSTTATLRVEPNATLTLPMVTELDRLNLNVAGAISGVSDFRFTNGTWTYAPQTAHTFGAITLGSGALVEYGTTRRLEIIGKLELQGNAILRHQATSVTQGTAPGAQHLLDITCSEATIGPSAVIDLNGRGYNRGAGPGRGTSGGTAGGAGHGGAGGQSSGAIAGGAPYGSASLPDDIGSGGGDDTSSSNNTNGAGGGLLKLAVCGTFTLNGTIRANGETGETQEGGGGSGGAVRIDAGVFAGTGIITVNGGAGASNGSAGGGGGGGGRVAISYGAKTFSGSIAASGGARGGTGAATAGANGSIEQGERIDAVCANPPCGVGLCAGTFDATIGACDYAVSNGVNCSDGNACTTSDTCSVGTCVGGSAVVCNDDNTCTNDACDAQLGCRFTARAGACDDGNACTQNTVCVGTTCGGGTPTSCNDGNQCTADACDPVTGCASTPLSNTGCNDSDPCTSNDLCATGTCRGTPLEVPGCFAAFPGAPVIGPAIPRLVSRDGAVVLLDLTDHENDYEDGPPADDNLLVWSIDDLQPWLYDAVYDPGSEVLALTPLDPSTPFSTVFTVTLVDSDGMLDTQVVVFENITSTWLLEVEADASAIRPGQLATLTATLSSPAGRPVAGRLIELEPGAPVRGFLASRFATTDANGVATFRFDATTVGTQTFTARYDDGVDTAVAPGSIEVIGAAHDLAVYTLDLAFFDPLTGLEVFPGDVDPTPPGASLELRARVRNLGTQAAPPVVVTFSDRLVSFSPPAVFTPTTLATLMTPPLAAGAEVVLSHVATFDEPGFHLFGVEVDPDDAFAEDDEDNNIAAQGFWIGSVEGGSEGVIQTTCSLVAPLVDGGQPAVFQDEVLELSGRADYAPFLPFDPDGSLGIAAVRGGRVSLALFDTNGVEATYDQGGTVIMPVAGNRTTHRALHTIGQWLGPDQGPVGHFPNRASDDTWTFPAPPLGCYTVRACVDDASHTGCCEETFCVIPRGSDLACESPRLPSVSNEELAPAVGGETIVTALIDNDGDVVASPVRARLVVDGVTVATDDLGAIAARSSKVASFAWTPTCTTSELAVEVDFEGLVSERSELNNRCVRTSTDLVADRIVAGAGAGCAMDFGLVQLGTGGLPRPEVTGDIVVTAPSGATQTLGTQAGRGTLSAGPFVVDEAGLYTITGHLDTPMGGGLCGVAAEPIESANNTVTVTACADPSPWRALDGPNHQGLVDVSFGSSTFQYGQPVAVTAHLTNYGLIPLSSPLPVLLTTVRGPLLETDADAESDIKTLELSCADPLLPGQTKTVTWAWTPRYAPGDGQGELRELRVVVDPNTTLASCGNLNDTTSRTFGMNLGAALSGESLGLGPAVFTASVLHSGALIPNGEGGLVRFRLRRESGAELAVATDTIEAPAPGAPELFVFPVDLDADACDIDDPIVAAEVTADASDVYLETSEGDNTATIALPNLIPTKLEQEHAGCESRFFVEVESSPDQALPVGTWYAAVTLTPPSGPVIQQLAGPFSGVGRFEILSNIETYLAGDYVVSAVIDGRDTTACGDLFESDESDNTLTRTFSLCDDPSALVVGPDLQVSGPVRWGTPFTVTGYVTNAGDLALTGDVTARLALTDRPLSTVDAADKTLGFDCQDPLLPGQSRPITWTVTLDESEGVSGFVMTLDPDDARTDECAANNNVATRELWLDLSPWADYRGENHGTSIDLTVDQAGIGLQSQVSYEVHVRPPNPGADEPPIAIGPRGDEGAYTAHAWVSESGARTPIGVTGVGTPILGTPHLAAFVASGPGCDLFDLPSHLEVTVDAGGRLAENDENNNVTRRPFPNLTLGDLERSDVVQSRLALDAVVGQNRHPALPYPAFAVSGTLTAPSGATTPLSVGPVSAIGQVRLGSGLLVRENGQYQVVAVVDPPASGAECGVVAEQVEVDNTASFTFALCPDVTLSASFGATPAFGVPTPIEVELENIGNTTLIEDVALEVRGFTLDGAPVALDLDPPTPTIGSSPQAGVDPEGHRATTFTWTPSLGTARVARIEIRAIVLDTVSDNGAYIEAECRTNNNTTQLTTTLDQGCRATLSYASWQACSDEAAVTVGLSRPDSGAPVSPGELTALSATLEPLGGSWPTASTSLVLSPESAGTYRAMMPLPPGATLSPVRGRVIAQTSDGAGCSVEVDAVVQPGTPDLSIVSSDIHFLAKNGDAAPFTRANLGDAVDLRVDVANAADACQARNVIGTVRVELGFGQVILGTWSIPVLDPGAVAAVTLSPNMLLPVPPTLLAGGAFRWLVPAPSPWLHVFRADITGALVLDTRTTDNAATRSLLVGEFGASPGLAVRIVDPAPGTALVANSRRTTTLEVTDLGGDPVAPGELLRFSLFALDGEGAGAGDEVAIDLLSAGTYLGDGLYETELAVALPETRTLELVAMAGRVDGAAGGDEGTYPVAVGSVCFVAAESATSEDVPSHLIEVVLSLPDGQVLGEAAVVSLVDVGLGTADPGIDYGAPGQAVFAAGAESGATVALSLPILDDGQLELDETVVLGLDGGPLLACEVEGAAMTHTVTLVDDDLLNCACDDGDACTIDRCDETGACTHLPITPRPVPDATCDGVDDDCDGATDEDFAGTPEICGENACAQPATTSCVGGEVRSGCDPLWSSISELGDDFCPPAVSEEVAYAIAYERGQPVGTIRCYNRPGDASPVRCDTEADGVTLIVYDGLHCPL